MYLSVGNNALSQSIIPDLAEIHSLSSSIFCVYTRDYSHSFKYKKASHSLRKADKYSSLRMQDLTGTARECYFRLREVENAFLQGAL